MENLSSHCSLGVLAEVAGAVSLEIESEDKFINSPAIFSENVPLTLRSYSSSKSPVSSRFTPSHSPTFNLNYPKTHAQAVSYKPILSPENSYIPVIRQAGQSVTVDADLFANHINALGTGDAVSDSLQNNFKQKLYQHPKPDTALSNLNAADSGDIYSMNHSSLQREDDRMNLLQIHKHRYDLCYKEFCVFEADELRLHMEGEEIRASLLKLQDQLNQVEMKKIEIRKRVQYLSEEIKSQTQKISEISSQISKHEEAETRGIEKSDLEAVMILNSVQQANTERASQTQSENKRSISPSRDESNKKNKRSRENNDFTKEKNFFPSPANSNEIDSLASECVPSLSRRRISDVCRDFNKYNCWINSKGQNCMKEHVCVICHGQHSIENCILDRHICLQFNLDKNSCHENSCGQEHRCLRCASTGHGYLSCMISPPGNSGPDGEFCCVWNSQSMKSNDINSLSCSCNDSKKIHLCLRCSGRHPAVICPANTEMYMSFEPNPTFTQNLDRCEPRIPGGIEGGEYVDKREFEDPDVYNDTNGLLHGNFINALNDNRTNGFRLPPVFENRSDTQICGEQSIIQYPSVSSLGPKGNSDEIMREGNKIFSPSIFNKMPGSQSSNSNHQSNIVNHHVFKNTTIKHPQQISPLQLPTMNIGIHPSPNPIGQQFTTMHNNEASPNQNRNFQSLQNVNSHKQNLKTSPRAKIDGTNQTKTQDGKTPPARMSHAKAMAVALAAGLPKPRFPCQYCNRNFSRSDSLKRHIRIKLCNGDNPTPPRKNPKKLA
ncbi:hypothetical protein HK096_006498 [Nowakowskiella sp. JEL0078]|nr:hypothetical protein HK096_006498 [Nowakowskiella sp. JEL0078]